MPEQVAMLRAKCPNLRRIVRDMPFLHTSHTIAFESGVECGTVHIHSVQRQAKRDSVIASLDDVKRREVWAGWEIRRTGTLELS